MAKGADELKFLLKKSEISVKDYCQRELGERVEYPLMNCLHLGNPDRNGYFPIEVRNITTQILKKISLILIFLVLFN